LTFDGRGDPQGRAGLAEAEHTRHAVNVSSTGSKPVRHPIWPRESAGVDGGLSSRVERGSKPLRGAKHRAAHGGQPVSKSGEQRSIRWLGATGMCEKSRAPALQASSLGALPSISTRCSRPMVRSAAWYAARADSISDGSSRRATSRVRCSWPHAWLPTKRTRIVPERAHSRTTGVPVARHFAKVDEGVRFSRGARMTSSTGVRRALQTRDGSARFRCSSQ
jgi:hypothetical protein